MIEEYVRMEKVEFEQVAKRRREAEEVENRLQGEKKELLRRHAK